MTDKINEEITEELKIFLKDNDVDAYWYVKIDLQAKYDIFTAINSIPWFMTNYSYYFWLFLQLKWLHYLLNNRKRFNLDAHLLNDRLQHFTSYLDKYKKENDEGKHPIGMAQYNVLKVKYRDLCTKYHNFLRKN